MPSRSRARQASGPSGGRDPSPRSRRPRRNTRGTRAIRRRRRCSPGRRRADGPPRGASRRGGSRCSKDGRSRSRRREGTCGPSRSSSAVLRATLLQARTRPPDAARSPAARLRGIRTRSSRPPPSSASTHPCFFRNPSGRRSTQGRACRMRRWSSDGRPAEPRPPARPRAASEYPARSSRRTSLASPSRKRGRRSGRHAPCLRRPAAATPGRADRRSRSRRRRRSRWGAAPRFPADRGREPDDLRGPVSSPHGGR